MSAEDDPTLLKSRLRTLRNRHHRLVKEYGQLKERVNEYSARRWISPGEELEKRALQRAKLQKKDALSLLRKELDALEQAASGGADTRP